MGESKKGRGPARALREVQASRESSSHRRALEQLFSGGGAQASGPAVPEKLKTLLAELPPEPDAQDPAWLAQVQALRSAEKEGFRALVKVASDFVRAGHTMPDDEALLTRLLDHPAEPVLRATLAHLLDLHERVTLSRTGPIIARLGTIEVMTEDVALLKLTQQLRAAL